MVNLKNQRAGLKGGLTILKKQVDAIDTDTISMTSYTFLSERLRDCRMKIEQNHDDLLEDLIDDDEVEEQIINQTAVEETLWEIQEALHEALEAIQARPAKNPATIPQPQSTVSPGPTTGTNPTPNIPTGTILAQPSTTVQKVKLPQLQVPKFAGKLEEWMLFRNRFNQAIHKRPDIADADKLQYLLSYLEGEPASMLSAVGLDDANYLPAWQQLESRYEHPRQLVYNYVAKIVSHPAITLRSSTAISSLSSSIKCSLDAIKALSFPVEHWDAIVVSIAVSKLDEETRLRFHQSLPDKQVPALKTLQEFLGKEVVDLTSSKPMQESSTRSKPTSYSHSKPDDKPLSCYVCKEEHFTFKCSKLIAAKDSEKKKLVENAKLCSNCLRPGHTWNSCKSIKTCFHCKKKHHSLLHSIYGKAKEDRNPSTTLNTETKLNIYGLKPTAVVTSLDSSGTPVDVRCMLDNCSGSNFITTAMVSRLGMKRQKLQHTERIEGLGGAKVTQVKEFTEVIIKSRYSKIPPIRFTALIVNSIGQPSPQRKFKNAWSHIPSQGLADSQFNIPRGVDILLSTGIYSDVIRSAILRGQQGEPIAQESSLGWLVYGNVPEENQSPSVCLNIAASTLHTELRKFWEIESYDKPSKKIYTPEQQAAEDHYVANTSRESDGSYTVRLPFKPSRKPLGHSKSQALKRLYSIEGKFSRDPEFHQQYVEAMREFISAGHMEPVPHSEQSIPDTDCYYLPHHAVVKESSSTTKLRVVFDDSAKTTSGESLNSQLMTGPTIQQDLLNILIRWRFWLVPISADIKQMYLHINVHSADRDFQRLLWRETSSDPIQMYRLKKVTFGTASAPFQAIRTLHKLASDYGEDFPLAVKAITEDCYVDDAMTGSNSTDEALQLQRELLAITAKATFLLRKWSSSNLQVLQTLDPSLLETQLPLSFDKDSTTKALGLIWNPSSDTFQFQFQPSSPKKVTKRTILSEMARVFDPLGLLAPVTIRAKMLMQVMWKEETGWDSSPSKPVLKEWTHYLEDLKVIHEFHVPRGINHNSAKYYQLHLFSDASERAFAACAYLRVVYEDGVQVCLIASKTRVSPVKPMTLPRLELCGAVVASHLGEVIQESLPIKFHSIAAWTDSTITLSWIRADPNRWNTFERNRVVAIQQLIPPDNWNHIPGNENPADLPTRGISVADLRSTPLWFQGPTFLHSQELFPKPVGNLKTVLQSKQPRPVPTTMVTTAESSGANVNAFLCRYSCWLKLTRHVAWWRRCFDWCSNKQSQNCFLKTTEIIKAQIDVIRFLQKQAYPEEMRSLHQKIKLQPKSPSLGLSPFLDENCLIRVGGRLELSDLHYNHKHPVILPRHHVTSLIVRWYHNELLHSGVRATAAMLQRKFWIIRGRRLIKKIINNCKPCTIAKAQPIHQLMADLPSTRVNMSRPFTNTGVDYAGPVILRDSIGRSPKTHKAWIAVYVCFSTKAVNLELVSALTTDAFLASFRRFISRRGRPVLIQSDNGKNFEGAKNQIELFHHLQSSTNQGAIVKGLSSQGIEWRFNPPAAPNMGVYGKQP